MGTTLQTDPYEAIQAQQALLLSRQRQQALPVPPAYQPPPAPAGPPQIDPQAPIRFAASPLGSDPDTTKSPGFGTTLMDLGKAAWASTLGLGTAGLSATSFMARELGGNPEIVQHLETARHELEGHVADTVEAMSPKGQQAFHAKLFGGTDDNGQAVPSPGDVGYARFAATQVANFIPTLVLAYLSGGIVGRAAMDLGASATVGAGAGMAATGAAFGGVQAGDAYSAIVDQVDKATDAQMRQGPAYAALRDQGMSEWQAKSAIVQKVAPIMVGAQFGLGAVTGAGLGGLATKGAMGAAGSTLGRRVALGAGEGAGTMAAMQGGGNALQQAASMQTGLQTQFDPHKMAEELAAGALGGAVAGGFAGMLHGAPRPAAPEAPPPAPAGPVDEATHAALQGALDLGTAGPGFNRGQAQGELFRSTDDANQPPPAPPPPPPPPAAPPTAPATPPPRPPVPGQGELNVGAPTVGSPAPAPTPAAPAGPRPSDGMSRGDLVDALMTMPGMDPRAIKRMTMNDMRARFDQHAAVTAAAPSAPPPGAPAVTVQALDPQGNVVHEVQAAPHQAVDAQTAVHTAAPEGTTRVVSGEQALDDRMKTAAAEPIGPEHPVDSAANQAAEPSPAQAEAGNYKKGHVQIQGLDISIENPKGSVRRGPVDAATGKPAWETPNMPGHYGYIKKTAGADGDHVDVTLGPRAAAIADSTQAQAHAEPVFVVDQIDPKTGKFDEHKAFVGFHSEAEAAAAYDGSFSDHSGPARRGAINTMTLGEFKEWIKGDTSKAVSYKPPTKGDLLKAKRAAEKARMAGTGERQRGTVGTVEVPGLEAGEPGEPASKPVAAPTETRGEATQKLMQALQGETRELPPHLTRLVAREINEALTGERPGPKGKPVAIEGHEPVETAADVRQAIAAWGKHITTRLPGTNLHRADIADRLLKRMGSALPRARDALEAGREDVDRTGTAAKQAGVLEGADVSETAGRVPDEQVETERGLTTEEAAKEAEAAAGGEAPTVGSEETSAGQVADYSEGGAKGKAETRAAGTTDMKRIGNDLIRDVIAGKRTVEEADAAYGKPQKGGRPRRWADLATFVRERLKGVDDGSVQEEMKALAEKSLSAKGREQTRITNEIKALVEALDPENVDRMKSMLRELEDPVGVAADKASARDNALTALRAKLGAPPARGRPDFEPTSAFRRWFGKSKVVDAQGEPLRVFHGTTSDIEAFDKGALGSNTGAPSAKEAFFFTAAPRVASEYADHATVQGNSTYRAARNEYKRLAGRLDDVVKAGDKPALDALLAQIKAQAARTEALRQWPNIVPAYLHMENPLVVDYTGQHRNTAEAFREVLARAKEAGHDGAILKNVVDTMKLHQRSDIYAVFEPTQIKSAVSNSGAYDRTNPRIHGRPDFEPEVDAALNGPKPGVLDKAVADFRAIAGKGISSEDLESDRVAAERRRYELGLRVTAEMRNDSVAHWEQKLKNPNLTADKRASLERLLAKDQARLEAHLQTMIAAKVTMDGVGGRAFDAARKTELQKWLDDNKPSARGSSLTLENGAISDRLLRDPAIDGKLRDAVSQMHAAGETRSVNDLLGEVAKNPSLRLQLPMYSELAARLREMLPDSLQVMSPTTAGLKFRDPGLANRGSDAGTYWPAFRGREAFISLNPSARNSRTETLIHEALHAVTSDYIEDLKPNSREYKALDLIRNELKQAFAKDSAEPRPGEQEIVYGLSDFHELHTMLMSNPTLQAFAETHQPSLQFQQQMHALGYGLRETGSVWKSFVGFVRRMLGMADNSTSTLAYALRPATEILENAHYASNTPVDLGEWTAHSMPDFKGRAQEAIDRIDPKGLGDKSMRAALTGATTDGIVKWNGPLFERSARDGAGNALENYRTATEAVAAKSTTFREQFADSVRGLLTRLSGPAKDDLARLMNDATIAGVKLGPGADNSHLVRTTGPDAGKMSAADSAALDALTARFKALPAEAQATYAEARDYYRKTFEIEREGQIRSLVKTALPEATEAQVAAVARAGRTLKGLAQLREGNHPDVNAAFPSAPAGVAKLVRLIGRVHAIGFVKGDYFPLRRYGDYVVRYGDKGSDDYGVEMFERRSDAEARRAELLRSSGTDVSQVLDKRDPPRGGTMPTGTVDEVLKGMARDPDLAAHTDKMHDLLHNIMLQSASHSEAARARMRRAGVAGASLHIERTLARDFLATASRVGYLEHGPDRAEALRAMQLHADGLGRTGDPGEQIRAQAVVNELQQRMPSGDDGSGFWAGFGRKMSAMGYVQSLMSPSHMITSTLEAHMNSTAMLSARHGPLAALALAKALRDVTPGVTGQGVHMTLKAIGRGLKSADWNLSTVARDRLIAKGADRAAMTDLFNRLNAAGLIDHSMVREMQRMANPGKDFTKGWWNKFMDFNGVMAHAVDVANKSAIAKAAYDLELRRGKGHDAAAKYAVQMARDAMPNYNAGNKARIATAQSPLPFGKLAGPLTQFKQYGIHMYSVMANLAHAGLHGATKEERNESRLALAGILATHSLVAGAIAGSPLGDALRWIGGAYDYLSGAAKPHDYENDVRRWAAGAFGPTVGELLTRGVPHAAGIDVHRRVGLSNLLEPPELNSFDKKGVLEAVASAMTGASGEDAIAMATGIKKLWNGDVAGGLKSVVPRVIRDPMKAVDLASKGVTDSQGKTILPASKLSGGDVAAQAVGFQPARVTEFREGRNAVLEAREESQQAHQQAMARIAAADPEDRGALLQKYNVANPGNRITYSQLLQAQTRARNAARQPVGQFGLRLPRNQATGLSSAGAFANYQ